MISNEQFKIIISPSKTMRRTEISPKSQPLFKTEQSRILKSLQMMDLNTLQNYYKCSETIAKENHERLQNFDEQFSAMVSYTGAQFQAINIETLSDDALKYLEAHVFIVSGLYGLLRPFDQIGLYRLPMALNYGKKTLASYWQPVLTQALKNKTIINLASKEYSVVFDQHPNIIDIQFMVSKNNQFKSVSTMIKKLRGLFLRDMAINQVHTLGGLKTMCVEGYCYEETLSSNHRYVYLKK